MSKKILTNIIILALLVGAVWGVGVWQRGVRATNLLGQMHSPNDYEAYQAMSKLDSLGPSALVRAVPLLNAPQPEMRARAAILVGETADARYAPQVQALLRDQDATVRGAAATALGRLGAPEAAEPLATLLQDATQPLEVRTAAAHSLGLLASPPTAAALIAVLQAPPDPQQAVLREAAAASLGAVKSKEAVDALIALVKDDQDTVVRTLAAEALGHVPGDDKEQLIVAASTLGGVLTDRDPTGQKLAPPEVRIAAAQALGTMSLPPEIADGVRQYLQEAGNDDEYWVREAAKKARR